MFLELPKEEFLEAKSNAVGETFNRTSREQDAIHSSEVNDNQIISY